MFAALAPARKILPFRFDPKLRGFQPVYHADEANRCPGCGRSHWYVGRLSAECAFCGTALPLSDTGLTGVGLLHRPRYQEAA